jgi:hypothetical protein
MHRHEGGVLVNYDEIRWALAHGERVFHWSSYWRSWDEVLSCEADSHWVVVRGVGETTERRHTTDLFSRGDIVTTVPPPPALKDRNCTATAPCGECAHSWCLS